MLTASSPQSQAAAFLPGAPIPPDAHPWVTAAAWDALLSDEESVVSAARLMRCSNSHAAEMMAAARERLQERKDAQAMRCQLPLHRRIDDAESLLRHGGLVRPASSRRAWGDVVLGLRRVPA